MQPATFADPLFLARSCAFHLWLTLCNSDWKFAFAQLPYLAAALSVQVGATQGRRPDIWAMFHEYSRLAAALDDSSPERARAAVRGMLEAAGMAA